jgi:peptidyl-prolyl cis-trans isomerase D
MLSLMRKHAGSWMIKVVLGAIVVTFVFWGGYQFTSQRLSRIASVNGQWISVDDYDNTYKQLLNQVRRTFGNNLTDDLLQSLGLRKRALDQLIDQAVMLQAAEELNLTLTDDEPAAYLTKRNISWSSPRTNSAARNSRPCSVSPCCFKS